MNYVNCNKEDLEKEYAALVAEYEEENRISQKTTPVWSFKPSNYLIKHER